MVKPLPPTELLVIDVEASCYGPGETPGLKEIIQIGICRYDSRARTFTQSALFVTSQWSEVTPFCTELTGITPAQRASGVPFTEACRILREGHGSAAHLWASYGDYDREQFQRDCRLNEVAYPFGTRHLNVKTLAALMCGTSEMGMARMLSHLALPLVGRHHDAGDDARNIAAILDHLIHRARRRGSHE